MQEALDDTKICSHAHLSGIRLFDPSWFRARGGSSAPRGRPRRRGTICPFESQRQPRRLGSIRLDPSVGISVPFDVEPQHSSRQPAQRRPRLSRAHDRTGGWAPNFDSTPHDSPSRAAPPEPAGSPLPALADFTMAPPSLLASSPLVWWLLGRSVHPSGSHLDCHRQFVLLDHLRGLWNHLRPLQPVVPAGHVRGRRGPRAHRASCRLPG